LEAVEPECPVPLVRGRSVEDQRTPELHRQASNALTQLHLDFRYHGLGEYARVEDERLRWILFDGASGIIANNLTVNINQHASDGQEGNGIRERNEPFAPGDNDLPVWINHKVVTTTRRPASWSTARWPR
jgi:hypothetical protein